MKKLLALLIACGWSLSAHAQLVNIEAMRMQTDSVRFALKADALLNYSNQNGEAYFATGANLTTQFKSEDLDKIYFLVANYNLVRAEGTDYQNSWFLHARYNQKLSRLFRAEAFVQYQNNQLLVIDSRFLLGAGIRLKVLAGDYVGAYLGNAVMYEIENSRDFDQKSYNFRHSAYFSMTYSPKGIGVNLLNTVYFQPLYESLANHRVLEQFKIEIPVSEVISLSGTFNYSLISVTPAGTRDYTSNVLFGLTYSR
jgi:hypothetical protein